MVPMKGLLGMVLGCAVGGAGLVDAPDGAPQAKLRESIICCPNDSLVLDGWASIDPGGEVVEWLWDTDGDGKTDNVTDVGELVTVAPEEPKTYLVILLVRDNQRNVSLPDSATVHVVNSSPRIDMSSDTVVSLGSRVLFRPGVTALCGHVERYEWDFDGDGKYEYHSRSNPNTSRTFYRPGRYRARLRVVDSYGQVVGGVMGITVAPHRRK